MTRKELAIEIYKLDTILHNREGLKRNIDLKTWVKRALNGVGSAKGFKKAELEQIYNRRKIEVEQG